MSRVRAEAVIASVMAAASMIGWPVAALAAPGPDDGEVVFRQRCQICHVLEPGKPATMGPNLHGVVNRRAGATAFRYSDALKQSNLTWTTANLDRFLAAPSKMMPGTRMVNGVPDPDQRRALIAYLARSR